MPNVDVNNVQVSEHGNWANVIYTFPRGTVDDGRNTLACSDPNNPGRPKQFTKGQNYYIRYRLNSNNQEEKWDGECEYEPGGTAGVQFGQLDMLD